MRTLSGPQTLDLADHLTDIYAEAFAAEPWNKGPADAAEFRDRLRADTRRPGFRAVVADDGFATAWRTVLPLPDSRAYPRLVAHVGPDRLGPLLDGATEVDELAVRPSAQGTGLGRRLLTALIPPHERAWLLTSPQATAAVAFYHRVGWRPVPPQPGVDSRLAVFTSPE